MGSKEGGSDEIPHTVTLSAYYMGGYEVPFAEYDAFCVATGKDKPADEGWGRQKPPVINVHWYDALEYCNWLSKKQNLQTVHTIDKSRKDPNNQSGTDRLKWFIGINWEANGYRLPTEAEWEYAARSRGEDQNWAGTSNESQVTSFANGSGETDGYEYTSPVGTFKANDLGLVDMSGNVWEWCWDWYDADYYNKNTNANPIAPNTGAVRVLPGGSWVRYPSYLRCVLRSGSDPVYRNVVIGFRLSRAGR